MRERLLSRMQRHFAGTHAQRHLAACRYHLPRELPSPEAQAFAQALADHLWRQEYHPAWLAAEQLGLACRPPAPFWSELKWAAQHLRREVEALACAERELHQRWEAPGPPLTVQHVQHVHSMRPGPP